MELTHRWRPPLPTIGRGGPTVIVPLRGTVLHKLEDYYSSLRSCASFLERRISPYQMVRSGVQRTGPLFLDQMGPGAQEKILLKTLYYRASTQFKKRLGRLLFAGKLNQVKAWWHTADAVVLPYLISRVDEPDYRHIDQLTRWALENCANNYAQFQRDLKALKKSLRKHYATHATMDGMACKATMLPYYRIFLENVPYDGPSDLARYVLLWSQTRATGLANQKMVEASVSKFISTTTEPNDRVSMDPTVLLDTLGGLHDVRPSKGVVSIGTTSCLESTRQQGGKTSYLKRLCRTKSLKVTYDWDDLTPHPIEARPVRSSRDLVDWAIGVALQHPRYVRLVRLHVVVEPSKARTITVASFAYQVLVGVFAHIYQDTLRSKGVSGGLRADRHLWKFMRQRLNPQSTDWEFLKDFEVLGLSTDLSEATDFGNKLVAKEVLHYCVRLTRGKLPLALSLLVKTLYISPRDVVVPVQGGYRVVHATRGWFMGDMMTKFMLTAVHDYCCRLSLLKVYTLVGDDEVALDSSRVRLETHLENLGKFFRVSEEDTYISSRLIFYCEEGSLIPQRASESVHVELRRGQSLRYIDYPRIRLMIHQKSETDSYSMTNLGRFALMGKEARWASQTNPDASSYYTMATLYQHLLVPQDADCSAPFTPEEIGGDGAWPHSAQFMRRVVDDKSRDPRETKWRLVSLMRNTFSHKLVRSQRLDKVVHKHHLFLPKVEGLRRILPEDAIIDPKTDEARLMLNSMRFQDIESPEATFLRLCRAAYYQALFRGKDPPEPVFSIDRKFTQGHSDPDVDYPLLRERWANPGFRTRDFDSWFVHRPAVETINPMCIGLTGDKEGYPSSRSLFNDWAQANMSFEDTSLPDILLMIREQRPLPNRVVDRLNLFMESDNYILHMLKECRRVTTIVTRDLKLCLRVRQTLDSREPGIPHYVVAVDPLIYLLGMVEALDGQLLEVGVRYQSSDGEIIPDPGAMLHVDYTEFTDGCPHDEQLFEKTPKIFSPPRHRPGVYPAKLVLDG
nr:RNA-dependent RNA polymerase [Ustilaginoidea virens narnavirus 1]